MEIYNNGINGAYAAYAGANLDRAYDGSGASSNGDSVDGANEGSNDGDSSRIEEEEEALANDTVSLACSYVLDHEGRPMLGQVVVCNRATSLLYDRWVCPTGAVGDYRNDETQLTARELFGPEAIPFDVVRREVYGWIRGTILVSHSSWFCLQLLNLTHPFANLRDLALCRGCQQIDPQAQSLEQMQMYIRSLLSLGQQYLPPVQRSLLPQAGERFHLVSQAEAQIVIYQVLRWEANIAPNISTSYPPPLEFRHLYI